MRWPRRWSRAPVFVPPTTPLATQHELILELTAAAVDLQAQVLELKDLACSLHLYISYYTWTQLTTDQKELLADCIDEEHRRQDKNDGYEPGSHMAYTPTERWWNK